MSAAFFSEKTAIRGDFSAGFSIPTKSTPPGFHCWTLRCLPTLFSLIPVHQVVALHESFSAVISSRSDLLNCPENPRFRHDKPGQWRRVAFDGSPCCSATTNRPAMLTTSKHSPMMGLQKPLAACARRRGIVENHAPTWSQWATPPNPH